MGPAGRRRLRLGLEEAVEQADGGGVEAIGGGQGPVGCAGLGHLGPHLVGQHLEGSREGGQNF